MAVSKDGKQPLETREYEVPEEGDGQRIDVFLANVNPDLSRSKAQAAIRDGLVLLNQKACRVSEKLELGDKVSIQIKPKFSVDHLVPIKMDLDVIFEDEYLIVINKPAGLMVHPGAGTHGPTLVEGLAYHSKQLSRKGGEFRPGIVHRLDKDTSGVIVCAKDDATHEQLAKQFKQKANYREYLGVLDGRMKEEYVVRESYLSRDIRSRVKFASMEIAEYQERYSGDFEAPASLRYAKSHFRRIKTFSNRLTLAAIQLETGRTHQIRVHARDLSLPILCDTVYGYELNLPATFKKDVRQHISTITRQMLHAKILGFEHPRTKKKMAFEAPLPNDLKLLLEFLEPLTDQ